MKTALRTIAWRAFCAWAGWAATACAPAAEVPAWTRLEDVVEAGSWEVVPLPQGELARDLDVDVFADWAFPGDRDPEREEAADGREVLAFHCPRGGRVRAPEGFTVDGGVITEALFTADLGNELGSQFEFEWTAEDGERYRMGATDSESGLLTFRVDLEKNSGWRGVIRDFAIVPTVAAQGATVRLHSIRFRSRFAGLSEDGWGRGEVFLGAEFRQAVYAAAPATLRLPHYVHSGARLHLGFGLAGAAGRARMEVRAEVDGAVETLFSEEVGAGAGWSDRTVSLERVAGQSVELVLSATPVGDRETDGALVACWADPIVRVGPDPRPDVFVYLADTLRADHLEPYGYSLGISPNLSRLAERSVVFERCVAQGNWTKSSVPSLLTSTYVARHGVPRHRLKIPADLTTLAEALRASGYRTASFLTNRIAGHDSGLERGFSVVFDNARAGKAERDPARSLPARVLPWVRAHAEEPLFVYVHTAEPHTPYEPPADLRLPSSYEGDVDGDNFHKRAKTDEEVRHVISLYDGEIAHMDRALGGFVDGLSESGIFEDAWFVFTSDHGEAFREHGAFRHGVGLYYHQIDVPLLVHRPGDVSAGTRRAELVQSIDVMPTLLEAVGVALPASVQGRGLFASERSSAEFPWEGAVSEAAPLAGETAGTLEWAYEDDDWKVILGTGPKGVERFVIYDLRQDPLEKAPLDWPLDADTGAELEPVLAELRRWRDASAEGGDDADDSSTRDLGALEELQALGYIGDDE